MSDRLAEAMLTEEEYEPIRRALFERSNGSASSAKAALAECLTKDGYVIVRREDLAALYLDWCTDDGPPDVATQDAVLRLRAALDEGE